MGRMNTGADSGVDFTIDRADDVLSDLTEANVTPTEQHLENVVAHRFAVAQGEQSWFDTESVLDELSPLPSRVKGQNPLDIEGLRDTIDIDRWTLMRDSDETTVQSASCTEPEQGIDSKVTAPSGTGSATSSVEPNIDGTSTTGETPSPKTEQSDFDAQPAAGEYGQLHADSNEDGDFDGMDARVDGLAQEES